MAATGERRVTVFALVLAVVALAVLIGDKVVNDRVAENEAWDLLLLVFSAIALVCGVAVIVSQRRRRRAEEAEPVIDLRERLGHLVDLDDRFVDEELNIG